MIFYIIFALMMLVALGCAWQIVRADFRRRIIPDVFLFPLMLIGFVTVAWCPFWIVGPAMASVGALFGYMLAAGVGFVFDKLQRRKNPDVISPIGMGDIKLIAVGGLWLGVRGLSIALIFACIGGVIWGRRRGQKYIPFAPFLIGGGILALIAEFCMI